MSLVPASICVGLTGIQISSVQGKRYFTCPPSRGAFVRPDRVTVGDFSPEDLELDDDEEI